MLFILSELMPYFNFKNCYSINQVIIHFLTRHNCVHSVELAAMQLEENAQALQEGIATLKSEVLAELRNEINEIRTVRKSLDGMPPV